MRLNDITKNVHIIHLVHREDRYHHFIAESKKHDLDFSVHLGINGHEIKNRSGLRPGEYALSLSYSKLIEKAKDWELPEVLVMEDDFEIVDDCEERLEIEWPQIPQNWDCVYFGFQRWHCGAGDPPPEFVTQDVVRNFSDYGGHAILWRANMYDEILNVLKPRDRPIDVAFCDLQKKFNSFSFTRAFIKQWDSESSIIGFNPGYAAKGYFDC